MKRNRDLIPEAIKLYNETKAHKVEPRQLHALLRCFAIIHSNVHATARYHRARGEVPHLSFMDPPPARTGGKATTKK